MKCAYIYGLYDPRGDLRNGLFDSEIGIRYIGKTTLSVKKRLKHHINDAINGERWRNSIWIRNLIRKGLSPSLKILEICERDLHAEREICYIKFFRDNGSNLTNTTNGGEGMLGYRCTLGRKHSKNTKEKMSKSHSGVLHSEEHKHKISLSLIGNKNSFGCKRSLETRNRMSISATNRYKRERHETV